MRRELVRPAGATPETTTISFGFPATVPPTSKTDQGPNGALVSRNAASLVPRAVSQLLWKSTRLNSSHPSISYAVFCLKKKKRTKHPTRLTGERPENIVLI